MIVRILHEGQFDIDGRDLDTLNDLDNQLVTAVAAGNEQQFGALSPQSVSRRATRAARAQNQDTAARKTHALG